MLGRLFHRLFERKSDAAFEALLGIGFATAAQIAVTPETALRCVPVYAGVRVRCEVIGSLPLHLYERRAGGGKDRATEHPLYRLLHDRPNAWTSAADFVMRIEKDTITHGGGFALANRAGDKIVELIRLAPGSVCEEIDDRTLEPSYKVTLRDGSHRLYPWRDILHVPALDGLAAIRQAREAIGLTMALEKHAGALLGNGARPSGVLRLKRKIDDATYERLRKSWSSGHGGENSGKTAILEDDADFTPLTFNSVDLQFQEMRSHQILEISRALGVPPMLLSEYGRATWGNAEQMAQSFLSFTILPRLRLWQGAVSRLLSEEEQQTYCPEFLVDELVKAEIAARFEAYAKAITNGILNPNEVRALENRPPYEGGDEFRVAMNTEPPGAAEKPPAQQAKPRVVA
jgi:HK97 family phage portal protein